MRPYVNCLTRGAVTGPSNVPCGPSTDVGSRDRGRGSEIAELIEAEGLRLEAIAGRRFRAPAERASSVQS